MAQEGRLHIAKYAPPPPELPIYQQLDPRTVSFIGRTNYEAPLETKKYIFGIKRADRRRHLYIIGRSGVGKTKLIELLIRQDIAYGFGCCLIDPHGDIINDIVDFIPKERIRDVIIMNPSDMEWPISFNPLQRVSPDLKHDIAHGFIEIMERHFSANWTPRLEHVFRFTVLALLDYPDATLYGLIQLLTDETYRREVIEHIQDEMVRHFFTVEFNDWSERFNGDAIMPLVNKLGQVLSMPMLRNIFTQRDNKIDVNDIINSQKILLVNLSKGKLGEEISSFFGAMLMIKIKQAAMARARIVGKEIKDFYLYIDEFHNFATPAFMNFFTEARKYGIALAVTSQYTAQLTPTALSSILGNVTNLIIFRVGGEDAERLESEMIPVFKAKDMVNLGMKEFYIKETIDGEPYDPFSANALSVLPPTHPSYKQEIIDYTRKNFAMSLHEISSLHHVPQKVPRVPL